MSLSLLTVNLLKLVIDLKKICILLCITVILMTFSGVTFADEKVPSVPSVSLSAPQPVIVPAEKEAVSGIAVVHEFLITCGFSGAVVFRSIAAVDKYIPEIMEQINIISVAPRE